MRSIWKGAISFGLVTIPIKVLGATENHSVSFRQLHTSDGGRIRYRKVCELEDREVSGQEISKAYEAADGTLVPLSDAELGNLPLPTAKTVEILGFVPVEQVELIQLDRSYYLASDSASEKPYVLLREALVRSGKGAIAKLAMRGRETLALLRPMEDGVLGMHTLLWPDEIRPAEGVAPRGKVTVRDAELDLADTLMESLGEVDMAALHDEYRSAVEQLVTAKLSGVEPAEAPAAPAGGKVIDLMSALEDSVRAARTSRGGEEGAATVTELEGRGAAKKTAGKRAASRGGSGGKARAAEKGAAKKPAAEKAAAKKATAKKSAAKKSAATTAKKTAKKTAAKKSAARGQDRKSA